MLQDIPDGVFCVDTDWRLLYLNRKAEEIAGRKKEELLGKKLWEEYPELIGTYIHSQYQAAMNTKETVRFEGYLPHFDAWFETSLYPKTRGLFIYFRDITEIRAQRKAATEQALRAETAHRDLEQMIYLVSHDLKEPLRMISSFLGLMKEKIQLSEDSDSQDFLGYVETAIGKLKQKAQELLIYSQFLNSKESFVELDLRKLLEDLIHSKRDLHFNRELKVDIQDSPKVFGSLEQMKLLFDILLSNSIKFSKESQPIDVRVFSKTQGDCLTICWQDKGVGIDRRYQDRIFQIFQRLSSPNTMVGSGLGLALARKIAQVHGGRIRLSESSGSSGEGAAFEIILPIHADQIKQRENIFRLVS
jgi:PAS domain S-box-containing protein